MPRYRFLTRSYVEALGLDEYVAFDRRPTAVWMSDDTTKPWTSQFRVFVMFEGRRYLRSYCGLSYDLS